MEKKDNVLKTIASYIMLILITFCIMLGLYQIVLPVRVNGESMIPNFLNNDRVVVYKKAYDEKSPKRGDVVVAYANIDGERTRIIKRVIGTPGDKIEFKDKHLYINGEEIKESYLNKSVITVEGDLGAPIIVEKDNYFCMGDNREDSEDSRDFGTIKKSNIIGKVVFRVFPFNKFGNPYREK